MISVIICSRSGSISTELFKNIEKTAGVPVEIITVDNSTGQFNISQAYNEGATQAQYKYLCFIHEDVLFTSTNWGEKILQLFTADPELGLIGLAGSLYKPDYITGWTTGIQQWDRANVWHGLPEGGTARYYINPEGRNTDNVITVDGVFMAVIQDVFKLVTFDENLEGFHFYDIEYSLRIKEAGFKALVVLNDIHLLHNSQGRFNNVWFRAAYKYHKANAQRLQVQLKRDLTFGKRNHAVESKIFWINRLGTEQLSFKNKVRLLFNYGFVADFRYACRALIFLLK